MSQSNLGPTFVVKIGIGRCGGVGSPLINVPSIKSNWQVRLLMSILDCERNVKYVGLSLHRRSAEREMHFHTHYYRECVCLCCALTLYKIANDLTGLTDWNVTNWFLAADCILMRRRGADNCCHNRSSDREIPITRILFQPGMLSRETGICTSWSRTSHLIIT